MSMFKVEVTAVNPKREEICTSPVDALVDTGSELTWLPKEVLKGIGITERRSRSFITADGKQLMRKVGFVILKVDGFETIDEVVFAEKGDISLLGVRTIQCFSVMVDNIGHRLVAQAQLVC